MSIDFRAFKIRRSNVVLAWDRVAEEFGLNEAEKRKIRMPKIEAFAVIDEDFERIHEQRREVSSKRSSFMRAAEWGDAHAPVEVCMAFTSNFRDKETDEVVKAEIFIRASIYKDNREEFYEILEHEIRHVMFPDLIMVHR